MAKCECGEIWLWDWCHDCFVDKLGEEHEVTELQSTHAEHIVQVWKCKCGRIKGVQENDGNVISNFDMGDEDWELDENSFPSDKHPY